MEFLIHKNQNSKYFRNNKNHLSFNYQKRKVIILKCKMKKIEKFVNINEK